MPTILRIDGFRFFFYSNDHAPMHIHVEKGDGTAKFTISPVLLMRSNRFPAHELKKARKLVEQNEEFIKTKWDEYFGNK
jgi:hypothetical protein